ncbi:hypothetical protein BDN67DRAFT_960978 [Paxillus ammoniavirescens]|nr:hypothetical protein BDN67DRAFT_960978 [Paxillus ammoniavirescens]
MFRNASHKSTRHLYVLDFLAPSAFGHRPASTLSRPVVITQQSAVNDKKKLPALPTSSQANDPAVLCQNIKDQISSLRNRGPAIPDPDVLFFNQRVVELRQALSARDIHRVWKHWLQLQERGLLGLFGPQLRGYSESLAKLCPRFSEAWDPRERKVVEEIALHTATGGAVDALVACMATYLRSGDSKATLDLYARFLQVSDGKVLSTQSLTPTSEEDAEVDELVMDDSHPRSSVHPNVLLAAITAHALENSFPAALSAYLQSPIRFPLHLMKEFLSTFHDKSLNAKVEDYVRRLHVARYISEPRILTARTSAFAASRDSQGLEKLYRSLIDGISGSEPYIAASPADVTVEHPVALEEVNWAAFLTAFLRCNRRDLAEALWNDMVRFRVRPTVITWTALLDGYDAMGEAEDAEKAWNTMIAVGVEPTAMSYRAIISTLFNARKPDDAVKYFALFQARLANGMTPTPEHSLTLYNTVIHGLLKNRREGDAHALLQRLREKGPKPDIISFNTLLHYHGRRGEFRTISRILEWIKEDGFVGDVYTFSTVLSALLKIGRTDATDAVLNLMRKQNIEPNVAVFTAIINHQMEEGAEQGLRAAMELLQKMEQNPEAQPNEVTYTGILASLHRHDWPDLTLARQCKQHVLEGMKKRNIQPNRATYHILIKASLENPTPEGMENALRYYRDMVKRKISIGPDTWYVLLRGLIAREAWAVADELVDDLTRERTLYGGLESLVGRIRKRRTWKMRLGPRAYF